MNDHYTYLDQGVITSFMNNDIAATEELFAVNAVHKRAFEQIVTKTACR